MRSARCPRAAGAKEEGVQGQSLRGGAETASPAPPSQDCLSVCIHFRSEVYGAVALSEYHVQPPTKERSALTRTQQLLGKEVSSCRALPPGRGAFRRLCPLDLMGPGRMWLRSLKVWSGEWPYADELHANSAEHTLHLPTTVTQPLLPLPYDCAIAVTTAVAS